MKQRKQTAGDMMTLGGEGIPRPVRKKGRLRLKAKQHRRLKKGLAAASAVAIVVGGTFGINALFFNKAAPNTVAEGFDTICLELPTDGSTPDLHSALENIGYMNARFQAQDVWYSEMQGSVNTMLSQQVNTWKQYSDGVLIQTDITTSSLINSAKQFCWVGDRVIWREAAGGPSTYDGIDTAWKDGAPYGNMSVEDYKVSRGLPGTAFSVYVINEETLLDASEVTANGDGTYTQTYHLDPATDKAPAYYVNQMMYTGGLTSLPTFDYITVTYTFDATWQVLSSEIEESYTATKGVNAKCTATYSTQYEYGTDRAYSTSYDDYFKSYADKPATGAPTEQELTAADCLAEAFGTVLTQPVTFSLQLTLNGQPFEGLVYVDASDTSALSLRARIGEVFLQYAGEDVFLRYGDGVKVKLSVPELTALISSLTEGNEVQTMAGKKGGISLDTDELLAQLGSGTFTVAEDKRSAMLSSELSLMGLQLPVTFRFLVGEDGAVTLGDVAARLTLGNTELGATLAFSQEELPALTEQEAAGYVPLMPYVQNVLSVLSGEALRVGVSYQMGDLAVEGSLDVMTDELCVQGTLTVAYKSAKKELSFLFADGAAYLAVDGIRIKADVTEALALLGNFVELPEMPELPDVSALDFGQLVSTALSPEFAALFAVSEADNALSLAVKGTEFLQAFGIDFALGDVALSVAEGEISAAALGAELSITAGEAFTYTTDGYVDGVKLAQNVLALLQNDYLCADIAYAAGNLAVSGTVTLDMNALAAKGTLVLNYKSATKTIGILYADGAVYVEVEGIRLTANVEELVSLIGSLLGKDVTLGTLEGDLIEQVLSMNFAELVSISEGETSVEILLKGTELLKAFGVDFALGDVALSVAEGEISAAALGAELTLTAGEAFTYTTDGYVDGVALAKNVLALLQNDYLCADIAYAAGELAVSGTVTLDMNALAAKGTLVLNYKSATKTVGVLYADGAVYVEVEGIRLTANVEELVSLIGSLLGKDVTLGTPEGDLIEQVLSLNFAELVSISEGETSVEILLKGTELLKAFGIDFALGDVALSVAEGEISASALGAELTLTAGEAFSFTTDGYVDGVALAKNVLALLQNDYLCADIAYAAGELAVSGTVTLDMNALAAKGTLVLNYKSATKTVGVLYADGAVYVEVEGIRLTANVEELVSLIGSLLGMDVTLGTPEGDLIEQVLSLNFAELVSISEGETSVEILLKGTELLKAFGIDFALGDVQLFVAEGEISAAALGADLTLTAGEAFTYTTDGYVDGVKLAQNVLALLQNDYLCADIAYAAGELAVSGTVTLDMNALAAKGTLVLNYKSATKTIGVLYADGAVYVEVEGIRLTANVEELVALIGSLLGKDVTLGTPEGDLIEQILSLNFAELVSISEGETSVEVLLKGTELLQAFGVDFALGDVALSVEEGEISAAALGAELTLTAGEAFSFTTDGYVDGVALAKNVLTLLQNDYLCADIAYAAGELAVSGTVTLDMNALAAKGTLVLNYKSATKTIGVLYADGAVYVEVEGIRLTANVEELVSLIGSLLGKDVTLDTPEGDLIEQVLSLNFAELVSISEGETSVEILLKGTELLQAFGVDFALGDVQLSVMEGEISASALGAELTLTAGEAFSYTTDGYVDGVALAKNVLTLLQNDYLCADIAYAAGELAVSGTVTLDVNKLAAKGTLVLNYKSATKTVGILYADGAVYVEVEGIRFTANVEELVALIGSLLGKDVTLGTPEGDLIEQVLSLNFAELVSISEGETSVEILLKGTELLKAFGIDFALGDVALSVMEGEISASALGAELTLTAGEAFSYTTDGYVDGVALAKNVLALLQNDYLCADIAYAAGELAVSGTVTLDVNKLAAKGTLVLNYKSATKTIGILYADGAVYVEVEGIRLTANVEELVSLIGSLLGKDVTLDTPEGDLIEQILSLNFAELVSISEGETSVEILLKGTELLQAFGVDFALGDVALSVAEGELSVAALGAELTLTAGEAFTYTTDGYVDGVRLAQNVLALLQNDYLCADIAYAAGNLAVSGTVTLDVNKLAAKGTLVLNYKSATKTVGVLYADGAVYVEVEGIRLTANVEELVALIGSLLGKDVTLGTPEGDLIEQVLSLNFAELVSISEGETSVEILLKGTELLKAFGIDFALGDVALSVAEGEISAAALGAELTLTAGEAFTYTTDGYVDGVALAKNILSLLQNDYLCADIAYAAGELAVSGTVTLDVNKLAAKGTLVLNYKSATKTVGVLYADGAVYVEVEGIRLTANVEELVSLIGSLLGKDVTLGTPEGDLIEQVLSLNFAELVSVSEGETSVEILLKGTELLKAFGIDFALGDVQLSVEEGEISAAALGAELTLTAGEAFTYTTDGYVDGVALAKNVLTLLQNDYLCADIAYAAGELAVSGTVTLDVNKLAAKGTLVLNYKSATKTVGILYADGAVYVEVEGIRLTANVEELVALIGSLLGKDVTLGTPEGDLIEQVLSLNFAELVSISEGETSVEILLKGTELLKAFGIDFALGDVALSVAEGGIFAAALGAELTLTAGEAFTYTTDGYVDGVKLAQNVFTLLQNDYLCADIAYAAGELAVSGTVTLDVNKLAAKGTLVLNYKSATKTVGILYADGAVYVEVEGIRLTANVEELVALIGSLLGKDVTLDTPEGDLIEQVLSLNFAELVSISEGETSVEILLKGTELLKAFGIDFALGDVQLSVEEGELSASALGAELTLTAGEAFSFTTDGYVDGVALAKNVLALLQNDYLCADIAYAAGELAVSGTVTLDVNKLAAKGTLVLNYKSATKTVGVLYADGAVYVEVEGIKLTANVEELVSLIGSLLGKDVTLGTPEGDLIEQILSLNFAELVSISEGETSVEILLKGTELLKAFGIDFALGDVALSVEEGEISAAALGAELTLTAGEAFTYTTDGYVELAPVFDLVKTVLTDGRIALGGSLKLKYKNMAAEVAIENGVLSWKDGFALSLDLTVIANGTRQTIKVSADASQLRLVYGSVGVALGYDELYKLSDTFEAVYERVARTIKSYVAGADIPATAEELMNTLGAGAAVTEIFASVDLPSLIDGVHFGGATGTEGSMGTVMLGGFTFDLIMQNGAFSLALAESKAGDVTLSGKADISASVRLPDAPAGTPEESGLMTADDLCELLDFVGAAVGTLASQDVTVSFAGGTKNADNEDVYNISGQLVYHAGASGKVVTIDVDGKSIVVDPTMYLVFRLVLEDKRTEGNDLYLDFWMFDAEGDGELDFFVSISKYPGKTYADDGETRLDQPLCFRVPAGDILTLLASGVSLTEGKLSGFLTGLGLPADAVDAVFSTLDAFFGSRWLTDTDKAQLGALGNVLMSTLGIDAKLEGILGELNSAIGGALDGAAAVDPGKYLSELGIRQDEKGVTFFLTLNSDLIYGGNGLAPLTIELTKTQAAGGESLLSGVLLGNVWGNKNTETTGISFGFAFGKTQLSASSADAQLTAADGTKLASLALEQFQSYTFKGVDELIKAIAASATYPVADGEYALNEKFIVEGTASASLDIFGGIDLTGIGVQLAVSLKEDGSPVVNIRISYEKYSFILPVINSDGVTDLTIEDGMVYVRRTAGGETTYRVAPLGKFFAGFLTEHLAYLFNFSDTIADAIKKAETSGGGSSSGDYGAVLGNILSSYSYAPSGSGKAASWSLTLNGNSLTNGALTDILLTLGTDEEGILRTLNVDTSLIDLIRISLPLTFQNPCGESYPDPTTNVKDLLSGADLASVDWNAMAENAYLAPQTSTVSYAVDGVQVGSQQVWYSGDMLLTALARPDLAAWQKEGYTLSWKDFAFTPNGTMEAVYSPKLYDVTIVAPVNLGGNWTDNGDGTFSYAMQMYYGAQVSVSFYGENYVYTMGADGVLRDDAGNAFDLTAFPASFMTADLSADGARIFLYENAVEVTYSDILGETQTVLYEQGTEVDLLTPAADGKTFLGWWQRTEEGWRQYTELVFEEDVQLEALWYSTVSGTMSGQRWYNGWFKDHHSNQIEMTGTFFASFASEIVLQSTDYRYAFDDSASTVPADDATGGTNSYQDSQLSSKDYAHAKVTQTYSLGDLTLTVVSVGHGEYTYDIGSAKTKMSADLTVERIVIA